jgi:hypothetical protein
MIPATTFDLLIRMGRARGGLEVDEIRQVLPVDAMTAEELADVLTRLEEAGISIEIDAALLAPRHRKTAMHQSQLATENSQYGEGATADHVHLSRLASSIKAASGNSRPILSHALMYVQMPATIFIITAAVILFLFVLSVWLFA